MRFDAHRLLRERGPAALERVEMVANSVADPDPEVDTLG